jgi:hypothetical protein
MKVEVKTRMEKYCILFNSGEESYRMAFDSELEMEDFIKDNDIVPYMQWKSFYTVDEYGTIIDWRK